MLLVEGLGHDYPWGGVSSDRCEACRGNPACNTTVCVASQGQAKTFASVCNVLDAYAKRNDLITVHIALGPCQKLLTESGKVDL